MAGTSHVILSTRRLELSIDTEEFEKVGEDAEFSISIGTGFSNGRDTDSVNIEMRRLTITDLKEVIRGFEEVIKKYQE